MAVGILIFFVLCVGMEGCDAHLPTHTHIYNKV